MSSGLPPLSPVDMPSTSSMITTRRFFRVAQVVVFDGLQVVVQLIDHRHAGGDIEFDDFLVGNVAQVFHQCAQAVAVGADQYLFAGFDLRFDVAFEVRHEAVDRVFQAF